VIVPVVDHLIARDGVPPLSGNAYDYVVAGDGLFVHASNRWLEVRVPVAGCDVRGLQPLGAACTLVHGKIPSALWHIVVRLLRQAHRGGCELLMGVRFTDCGYDLVLPEQSVAPLAVEYTTEEDLVLEIHSHRGGAARFSETDDADEQRLRLYGVVGKLDDLRPSVNLRAGAYGHFLPLPWSAVFAGDEGVVSDVNAQQQQLT
jgi:PRTRC genetic system protein A